MDIATEPYNPVKVILSFLGIVIILSALRFFSKYHFKVRNKKVSHAVALLFVNKKNKYLEIANPLYGLEKRSFNDLKGYWIGDAIIVNN